GGLRGRGGKKERAGLRPSGGIEAGRRRLPAGRVRPKLCVEARDRACLRGPGGADQVAASGLRLYRHSAVLPPPACEERRRSGKALLRRKADGHVPPRGARHAGRVRGGRASAVRGLLPPVATALPQGQGADRGRGDRGDPARALGVRPPAGPGRPRRLAELADRPEGGAGRLFRGSRVPRARPARLPRRPDRAGPRRHGEPAGIVPGPRFGLRRLDARGRRDGIGVLELRRPRAHGRDGDHRIGGPPPLPGVRGRAPRHRDEGRRRSRRDRQSRPDPTAPCREDDAAPLRYGRSPVDGDERGADGVGGRRDIRRATHL
ncbi:MAG: Oxidoreductase, partial [uncultured Sphingomonadaceae bacterium]